MGRRNQRKRSNQTSKIDDSASVCSEESIDQVSVISEEHSNSQSNEDSTVIDVEERVKDQIDRLYNKSVKTRLDAMQNLEKLLSTNMLTSLLENWTDTITDLCMKIIKKGKYDEQKASISILCQLFIQVGSDHYSKTIDEIRSILNTMISNYSLSYKTRESLLSAFGVMAFLSDDDDKQIYPQLLSTCEKLIIDSSLTSTDALDLTATALTTWTLLSTLKPVIQFASNMVVLKNVIRLMEFEHVAVRVACARLIGVLYEKLYTLDEDDEWEGSSNFWNNIHPNILTSLEHICKENTKHISKKDKRAQRVGMRDVLCLVESADSFPEESIRLGTETLVLDSLHRSVHYDCIKGVIGSGMSYHLQHNVFLRSVFDMGPPPIIINIHGPGASDRIPKSTRNFFNQVAFKSQTLARKKQRDKRAYMCNFDYQ